VFDLISIYCPQCGDAAEDMPPQEWQESGEVPGYRHVADRRALCRLRTRNGYSPAEPVEGEVDS
jgi:hypothetical protein